jgi:hypothetical protein
MDFRLDHRHEPGTPYFFLLVPSQSHSSFHCTAVGIIPNPTQVRARGLLRCVRPGPPSTERDHMDMSRSSEAKLTRFAFDLRHLFLPAARLYHYLPRVSLSPSRALSWPLPREGFQIIHGWRRNEGSRAPMLSQTPPEIWRRRSYWCALNTHITLTIR